MNKRVQIRTEVRQLRQRLSHVEQLQASTQLKERLISHRDIIDAQRIAIYLANDAELDTMSFIHWCWQQGKEVYLPVLHPFCPGHLLFLRYESNTVMVGNIFGIKEPKLDVTKVCPLLQLDVMLTPLVAFDDSGARLGMGGGFYDRTLANWYKNQQNITNSITFLKHEENFHPIGLAHECQQVSSIPTESWDIPLPEIVTPSKTYRF